MKIVLITLAFLSGCLFATAQKIWTGTGGNKLWNTAANWSPAGPPGSLDNVVVNISDSVEINVAVNINSLTITGNSAVIFSLSGSSRTITLSSTSAIQLGLLIDAGSSLTVQANIISASTQSLTLALTGGIGVTGEIYGSLFFKSVGSGSGGSNTQLSTFSGATSYAQLHVKNGGLIKYDDKTSNTTSAGSPINSITMEAGSTYWVNKNGGSFPDGSWAPTSLCKTTGTIANGATFNGSVYGNLEWNCPLQSAVYGFNKDISFNDISFISTGSSLVRVKTGASAGIPTLTVNGNLSIASGVTVETSGSTVTAPNGGVIDLKGDLVNNGLLTETGPSGTRDTVIFSGASLQTISGAGTVTNQQTFKIDNAAGVTISQALSLPYLLVLKNGIVNTSGIGLLTLQSGCALITSASASYTNLNGAGYTNFGSENSYINGPVRKLGLSSTARWAFPVGSATQFRPIFVTSATGDFLVQYLQANPRAVYGTSYGVGLDHISRIEYWIITGTSSPVAKVELSFIDPNSGGVTSMPDLRVGHYNGAQWVDEGNTATTGSAGANGSVTSGSITGSFSPFTLASSTALNPLPLQTISLAATKINRSTALQWTVNADPDVQEYILERSADGRNFTTINHTVSVHSPQITTYRFTDMATGERVFYRVKALLQNGRSLYSTIIMLPGDAETVTVYPNPAQTTLQVALPKAGGQISITNAAGQTVYKTTATGQTISIDIQQWTKGYYQLQFVQPGSKMQRRSFVVN